MVHGPSVAGIHLHQTIQKCVYHPRIAKEPDSRKMGLLVQERDNPIHLLLERQKYRKLMKNELLCQNSWTQNPALLFYENQFRNFAQPFQDAIDLHVK